MGKFNKEKRFGGDKSFGGRDGFRDNGRPSMHKAVCSECGSDCEIPFRPSGGRPVFCSTCFEKQGGGSERRGGDRPNRFSDGPRRERPSFGDKQMHDAICAKCNATCQVPFRPTPGKPVYCSNCFDKNSKTNSNVSRSTVDYSEQFKMLNEKLDTLITLLTPKTVIEKPLEKKKEVKKTKTPAKKVTAKKKK